MRLMTAQAVILHCQKYKVQIFVSDGVLKIEVPSLSNITEQLRKILEIHRSLIYKHFGVPE